MKLSVKECLSFGWRTFKARLWFFVQLSLLLLAISLVSSVVQREITALFGASMGGVLSFCIAFVIDTFIGMGAWHIYLKAHDAIMTPSLRDLWHPKPFWNYIGTCVVIIVAVLIGLVLLIVPGVIVSLMFGFATILVIDQGMRPIEALKESARLTKGHRKELFLLLLACIGVNLLGLLALVIGLIVSIPMTTLALVHAYRTLSASPTAPLQ